MEKEFVTSEENIGKSVIFDWEDDPAVKGIIAGTVYKTDDPDNQAYIVHVDDEELGWGYGYMEECLSRVITVTKTIDNLGELRHKGSFLFVSNENEEVLIGE